MIPVRLGMVGYINGSSALLEIAARYANKRKAFGQPIRNFEADVHLSSEEAAEEKVYE